MHCLHLIWMILWYKKILALQFKTKLSKMGHKINMMGDSTGWKMQFFMQIWSKPLSNTFWGIKKLMLQANKKI